ncbi:MAG: carboxypeptidase M32 [Nitrospiraceae bacterium]
MATLATLESLCARLRDIQHINSASSLLSWDMETYMPAGGGAARADQIATLQGLAHERLVATETERLLGQWVDLETGAPLDRPGDAWDETGRALLREVWRDYSRAKKLPSDFVVRMGRTTSLAQQVWVEARANNRFAEFEPSLSEILALKKEEVGYLGYEGSPYNALLDLYEPGSTVTTLTPLFAQIKARLVPLLKRVLASSVTIDDSLLHKTYDHARQLEFGRLVLTAMGYNFEQGRLDVSAHPFTTSFHPTDVRVTTRVFEQDLPSCLYSCIHEGGHGLYDQGLNPRHYGTPLGDSISLGIHESQSRLWENCVGRSKAFWRCFFPLLQQTFPEQLAGASMEQLYAAVNRVQPSFIRVEADELTYNLHVMLRFEIEQGLIEGHTKVADLPDLWRDKMRSYLNVVPERDADGVLQDIHWSMGSFGYFPTYTLGNLYSVQFYNQAKIELPNLERDIEGGRLTILRQWLQQKIHHWGRMFTAEKLVERITGGPLSPDPWLTYVENKYGELYKV